MQLLPGKIPSPGGRLRSIVIWGLVGALTFAVFVLLFPRALSYYWYPGIKRIFYEDLGYSDSVSTLIALALSLIYSSFWLPLIRHTIFSSTWRFRPRQFAVTFVGWMAVYGLTPALHAIYGGNVCFNQRTGTPLQWYVIEPGGQIRRFDSGGFDTNGVQKRPVTLQLCRILALQENGIRSRRIMTDVENLKFFDEVSGQPLVWYSKSKNGFILYDNEGIDPITGEVLSPVDRDAVSQILADAESRKGKAEQERRARDAEMKKQAEDKARAEKLEAQAKKVETERRMAQELAETFGVATYSPGTVIVGSESSQSDPISVDAAKQFVSQQVASFRTRGISADEFRPAVYSKGYFAGLLEGKVEVLSSVGLLNKIKGAVLANVAAECRKSTDLADVTSCTITARVRTINGAGNSQFQEYSETGAGLDSRQAVARATELLIQRHPTLLGGI